MENLKKLYFQYKEIILYVFFGGLTTLVNWAVHFPVYQATDMAWFSTAVAWTVAVLFAFFTNKPFVFESHDWSKQVVIPEFLKFIGCRVGSGVMELLLMGITVDFLHWNGIVMKIAISVFVIILNYIGSKWLFKK